jgi:glycosyltransferase involved in cell wall biosynthesis
MPTTADRRWCIPLAIRQFRRQSLPEADVELVAVFDGPGSIYDVMPPDDARVRLVEVPSGGSLGEKFNAGVANATGEYVALWADDDWHHPDRLKCALRELRYSGASVVGQRTALFYALADGDAYEYASPDATLVGGTCMFRRALARQIKFPDRPSGVDTAWFRALISAGIDLHEIESGPGYIAFQHGQTTGRKRWPPTTRVWSRCSRERLDALLSPMGDDLAAYRRAYTRR